MRFVFAFILFSLFLEAQGQDFRLFHPNLDYIYKSGEQVFGLRIDSTKEDGNTKINFFPSFFITKPNQSGYPDTAYSNGPGYFGNGYIEMPDSTYKFFSNYNDTLYFNPNLNSTDTGYFYTSGKIKITYTILPDSLKLVLDSSLTVKSYQFHYLDSSGNKINQYPNNELLQIANGLGIINLFSLIEIARSFSFEYLQDFYFNSQYSREFKLIGIPQINLGVEPLNPKTINEFEKNDVIQTEYFIARLYSGSSGYTYAKNLRYKFLSCRNKTITDSSIIYENNISYMDYYSENNNPYELTRRISFIDTVEYLNNIKYTLPGNFVSSVYGITFYEDLIDSGNYETRLISDDFGFQKVNDTIWKSYPFTSYCAIPSKHIRSLGGGYYDCTFSGGVSYSSYNKLVYYKKGNTEFGTPLNIEEPLTNNENFRVYPNPFIDQINFEGVEPNEINTIEVFDVSGKVLLQITPVEKRTLYLKMLPSGIYFIKVNLKSGSTINQKIIK